MATPENDRLPPGRQPYDALNGLRIGALAGGVLGVIATVLFSLANIGPTLAGAVIGGAAGYFSEKRKVKRELS